MYDACMANIQVRDVSAHTHEVLRRRAKKAGQSLQQYLLRVLTEEAAQPTIAELMAEIDELSGGRVGFEQAVEDIHQEREERELG